jgi:hypothetical protein
MARPVTKAADVRDRRMHSSQLHPLLSYTNLLATGQRTLRRLRRRSGVPLLLCLQRHLSVRAPLTSQPHGVAIGQPLRVQERVHRNPSRSSGENNSSASPGNMLASGSTPSTSWS